MIMSITGPRETHDYLCNLCAGYNLIPKKPKTKFGVGPAGSSSPSFLSFLTRYHPSPGHTQSMVEGHRAHECSLPPIPTRASE